MNLNRIEQKYNPEHDMPNGIQVTWVDHLLYQAIVEMQKTIERQEAKIAELEEHLGMIQETTGTLFR